MANRSVEIFPPRTCDLNEAFSFKLDVSVRILLLYLASIEPSSDKDVPASVPEANEEYNIPAHPSLILSRVELNVTLSDASVLGAVAMLQDSNDKMEDFADADIVTIDHGTDVLAGVKVQVADVEGRVEQYTGDVVEQTGTEVADDLNTSLADGNGFSNGNVGRIVSPAASIILDSRAIEDMCNEYTQVLNRTLNGPHGGIDLQKLCIIPGSTCWVVSVDMLIMDYGGNVLDTVLMAVRDDETEVLCGRENIPVALTLSRIGSGHIVDASPLEDMCSSSKITVFVNASGYIWSTKNWKGQFGAQHID
ncbi:hypothetical protein BSLG_005823 [Batrachochytrium salamandrivorans]|nr:hypothetical protein BSLG_005823 [Batrachochytrium salamandrivorans]